MEGKLFIRPMAHIHGFALPGLALFQLLLLAQGAVEATEIQVPPVRLEVF